MKSIVILLIASIVFVVIQIPTCSDQRIQPDSLQNSSFSTEEGGECMEDPSVPNTFTDSTQSNTQTTWDTNSQNQTTQTTETSASMQTTQTSPLSTTQTSSTQTYTITYTSSSTTNSSSSAISSVGSGGCPGDMVNINNTFCMDRYEASKSDASSSHPGTDESQAYSQPNVMPWYENPMGTTEFQIFQNACAAAGKRLCTADEFSEACSGSGSPTSYVYGNVFNPETCNCVDTFCDDYCVDNGIDPGSCSVGSNCGYTYYCFEMVQTGSFASCTNAFGMMDLNGNVWETVSSTTDSRGFELRGGAFNCASASSRVNCSFNAEWSSLYAGFRCCKDY